MAETNDCPHCKGRGFYEEFCTWGDGFEYRDWCGWCKGTGKVQSSEPKEASG